MSIRQCLKLLMVLTVAKYFFISCTYVYKANTIDKYIIIYTFTTLLQEKKTFLKNKYFRFLFHVYYKI